MTVAEATVIADNALEHTVRTILAALQSPEILKSTSGEALPYIAAWLDDCTTARLSAAQHECMGPHRSVALSCRQSIDSVCCNHICAGAWQPCAVKARKNESK